MAHNGKNGQLHVLITHGQKPWDKRLVGLQCYSECCILFILVSLTLQCQPWCTVWTSNLFHPAFKSNVTPEGLRYFCFKMPMPVPVQDSTLPLIGEELHLMGHGPPAQPDVNSSHPYSLTAPSGHDCT